MKKYVLIVLTIISLFALVACKGEDTVENNTAITAEFSDPEINQNSIKILLTMADPDNDITGTVYVYLYDSNDEYISKRSYNIDEDDILGDGVSVTFTSLGVEQSYYLEVTATVELDNVLIETYEFTTVGVIHIATVEAFLEMDSYRGADYVLDNDLDFTGIAFVSPFGSSYFSGTFDGQGYTLSNIDITTTKSTTNAANNYYYIGVFGYISSSAEIHDLILDNVTIGSQTEPAVLNNFARVGFLGGYVASSNAKIHDVTVSNSHAYIESNSENYVITGGLVGELKGELLRSTITNSSINLTTTSPQNDGKFLVRMGGAVGFLEQNAVLQDVNADVDLTYHLNGDSFVDEDRLKIAIGGVVGDNNAINTSNSLINVVAVGDIDVTIDVNASEEMTTGSLTLYVGGLVGYSSTKLLDAFFAGSIHVTQNETVNDAAMSMNLYVGALIGRYGTKALSQRLVWVSDGDVVTLDFDSNSIAYTDSLFGEKIGTTDHICGVYGAESYVINTIAQALTAPAITDMTDYFSSDFVNNAYANLVG